MEIFFQSISDVCPLIEKEHLLKMIKRSLCPQTCFCTDLQFEANESFPVLYTKARLTSWHETSALYNVLHKLEPHVVGVLTVYLCIVHFGNENELAILHFFLIFE